MLTGPRNTHACYAPLPRVYVESEDKVCSVVPPSGRGSTINGVVTRVDVPGAMIAWACERSGLPREALTRRFPRLDQWERGEVQPTLKQLEGFASATHTPIGYLFLPEPPDEPLPLPDFRTMENRLVGRPSSNLLDTIYDCQRRQEWYHDHALMVRESPVSVVGALSVQVAPTIAGAQMAERLGFPVHERGSTWGEAFKRLTDNVEDLGILVMTNGVVGSNTHRKLDPHEFRGFALIDEYAPLVFVNGADTKAAQIFTLAHELAHVWLARPGLDDLDPQWERTGSDIERWCNKVAAELLVPIESFRNSYRSSHDLTAELDRLAREYKVSTLVILGRIYDAGELSQEEYRVAYIRERDRVLAIMDDRESTGGNFYNTQPVRTSKRFTRALIASTLEGQTLHRDAFRMLGLKKVATFHELADRLGAA